MRKLKDCGFHLAISHTEARAALWWMAAVFIPLLLMIGIEAYELFQILK